MKKNILLCSIFVVFFFSSHSLFAQTNLNNFTISNYGVDIYLSRDAENHSKITTTEKITAVFPDFDQNRGITRNFVKNYNGHNTNLKLVSVTDENNIPREYNWVNDSLLRIAGEEYLHGENTYIITFTQQDVTRYYADTDKDEFYWDAIGVESLVPISNPVVRLHIDESLNESIRTSLFCYSGKDSNNIPCSVDGFTVTSQNLPPKNGLTIAIGFEKGTFVDIPPNESSEETILGSFLIFLMILFAIRILDMFLHSKKDKYKIFISDSKYKDLPIIPEYLPPKNYSLLMTSVVYGNNFNFDSGNKIVAQIIEWAVRKYILIYQTEKGSLLKESKYRFEIVRSFDDLKEEEKSLAKIIFGEEYNIGTSATLEDFEKRLDPGIFNSLQEKIRQQALTTTDLYELNPFWKKRQTRNKILDFFYNNFNSLYTSKYRTTDSFSQLELYLKGLKKNISVAEKTRLEMMQTPEAVEKIGDVSSDAGTKLKLYEKLLPYAILFKQERKWIKELGNLYDLNQTAPDWSVGTSFSAVLFSEMMSDISSSLAQSVVDSSGSSGGSSGGGYSGGGGGGGGVGGA